MSGGTRRWDGGDGRSGGGGCLTGPIASQVMNDGLALPLGEARELERTRAFEYYKGLTDGDFAAIAKKFSGRAKTKGAKPSAKL